MAHALGEAVAERTAKAASGLQPGADGCRGFGHNCGGSVCARNAVVSRHACCAASAT